MNNTDQAKVIHFGCRLNIYESEIIQSHLNAMNAENAFVINSCAVTQEAERQVKQTIRKLHREHPHHKIVVTGCASHINGQEYANMDGVVAVVDNKEKTQKSSYKFLQNIAKSESPPSGQIIDKSVINQSGAGALQYPTLRSRAFIEIQNGCDHRCTFCIIPYGRGDSRSTPVADVIAQAQKLTDAGVKEIVLTGVDLTSYGHDLENAPSLGQLVQDILNKVPNLPRLRLSSVDCIEIDDALLHAFATERRLMPHLHLSLQSGNDLILKRMKRRHLRDDALAFCHRLKKLRPDIVFGADFIVGFPTESDEMFHDTLKMVKECDLTYLHIFPYSRRDGTPAARIQKQVDKAVKKTTGI
jgi:threonylcarbamoyladenosine tRNA methylthiotransferase MtaB